ncbi:thioredoxin family protein [Desmospora profundinema]|uniref:Thioredoxin-like negative regulator of GroEL n=1 Tax=Desmospora profundinema TaxID=1571184 RepID=A0ABU1IN88_9BACL|nr:thioredoxin family protein [Desmospora profundinema]MDR6225639.1 thioredoxin-like negative regulator of GroEL [Desmospora profundinema]
MKQLDSNSFHPFIENGWKVVEFRAQWCFDCKRVAYSLPDLEEKYVSVFEMGELDVDESRAIPEAYGVKGVPAFLIFRDGREVARLMSKEAKREENIVRFFSEQFEESPLG